MENNNDFNSRFFSHIDAPTSIMLMDIDEFVFSVGAMVSGMVIALIFDIKVEGGVLVYALFGLSTMFIYKKYKKGKPIGYAYHKLYKLGIIHPTLFKVDIGNKKKKKNDFKVLPLGVTKKMTGQ